MSESHDHSTVSSSGVFQRLDQTASYPYTRAEYRRRFVWEWVQRICIRLSPRRAYRWRRFWLRRFGATLGRGAAIRPTTRIVHPWLLTLGEHVMLGDHVHVYNLGPVTIGEHTVVSAGVHLCAGTHDYTHPNLPLERPPIAIGRGVWICTEAFIGPGVTIGDNSVVGARAVVIKDVPAGVIVAGNPATIRKDRPMPTPRPAEAK